MRRKLLEKKKNEKPKKEKEHQKGFGNNERDKTAVGKRVQSRTSYKMELSISIGIWKMRNTCFVPEQLLAGKCFTKLKSNRKMYELYQIRNIQGNYEKILKTESI